ncbi:C39 family peptidase [Candidatus Gracilibacteria bacterium]|nr:C39 family peptidase [Candidatus Gracilibacteria bacterium]
MIKLSLEIKIGIITILTLCNSIGTSAKSGEDMLYTSLSYTLESILKSDTNILKMGYTGNLLSRIDAYRKGIYNEAEEIYPLIPSVWSKRPSMDTTYLYSPYIQKYPLSCEIATIKMILGSYGQRRSEESIYRAIPRDYSALSGGIWGDPDEEFVGSLTGTQGGRTGYGIYEAPLAKYLSNEGYATEIINNSSHTRQLRPKQHLIYLINQVQLGSRVILWGDWCTESADEDGILPKGGKSILQYFPISAKNYCTRSSEKRKFSWQTPENRTINAISGEHTFILLGYIGSLDNPTHIIVWDTYTGRHIFSYDEWMRKWELLDYRSLRVEKKR